MDGSEASSIWGYLTQSAHERWLCPEEIFIVLAADPASIGGFISRGFDFNFSNQCPHNGSLFIFMDKNAIKDDRIVYNKKKGTDRQQDTYQTIKLNRVDEISGIYSKSEEGVETEFGKILMKRRVYKLAKKDVPMHELYLVHYRECPEDERFEKHTLSSIIFEKYNQLYGSYIRQRAALESQKQLKSTQLQHNSFNYQPDIMSLKTERTYSGNFTQALPQVIQQHPPLSTLNHHHGQLSNSFSNGSQASVPDKSYDGFDAMESEMLEDLMTDLLDNEAALDVHLTLSSSPNSSMPSEALPPIALANDPQPPHSQEHMQVDITDTPAYRSHERLTFADMAQAVFHPYQHPPQTGDLAPQSLPVSALLCESMPMLSGLASSSAVRLLAISDFSPAQDFQQGGGTKVLICLDNEIPEQYRKHIIHVCFGDFRTRFSVRASAEVVTPSVLRCKTPANSQPGNCQIWIESESNVLSEPAEQPFEFNAPQGKATNQDTASKLGKRSKFRDSELRVNASASAAVPTGREPPPISPHGYRLPSHFAQGILRRSSPLRGDSYNGPGDFDKEHKIRIVEKLGTMKYALAHDEALQNGASSSSSPNDGSIPSGWSSARGLTPRLPGHSGIASTEGGEHAVVSTDGVKWLDDHELSELSTEDLETLMDRYIMVVVKQLVQLATMDDDLKAEIDSLDSSGFSLLHYCCLYNLNSLIPVLLARGADVNRRTSTGSTALHLAAGSGHLAVTQVLVESGALVDCYDASNMLPSDAAYETGYMDIYNLLLALENRDMDCAGSVPTAPMELSTEAPCVLQAILGGGNSPVSSYHPAVLQPGIPSLGPLTFSPIITASKARVEVPPLMFDSPPTAFVGELYDPSVTGSMDGGSSAQLSNKLLQEAFASLSLTDKCALSLSMGQMNPPASSSGIPSANSTPRINSKLNLNINSPHDGPILYGSSSNSAGNVDEINDMQSVLSEHDQESLQKAMSMMRHSELQEVENEVRTIQNNVRGWILRKNYTNLREAARVLQVAWREKKRSPATHTYLSQSQSQSHSSRPSDSPSPLTNLASGFGSKLSTETGSVGGGGGVASICQDPNRTQLQAAATLQAATRGMIARRSFSSVRKQTMASLVIQKSLVKWWEHSKFGGASAPTASPAPSSTKVSMP